VTDLCVRCGGAPIELPPRVRIALCEKCARDLRAALTWWAGIERRQNTEIYFCARADGLIKVGISSDLTKRVRTLERQFGQLTLLAAYRGDRIDERRIHDRFSDLRVEGEWFRPGAELRLFIAATNDPTVLDRLEANIERLAA
jgi:hypothetical protein